MRMWLLHHVFDKTIIRAVIRDDWKKVIMY